MTEIKVRCDYPDFVEREIKRKLEYREGILYWKHIKPLTSGDKSYNTKYAGQEAGGLKRYYKKLGYREIHIAGVIVKTHRVVWFLFNDTWPESEIDHINHDRTDNRIENLRLSSRSLQNKSTSRRRDNKSGCTGVYFNSRSGRWDAMIQENKKRVYLGSFSKLEDAITARKAAQATSSLSPTHGKNLSYFQEAPNGT